jgi:gamma-glutamylcyclotransferase (GGCT)/AIG2-like uncharacterized protein YtfP
MEQVTQEPQGSLYAVYGTLRQGFGNYERHLNNKHSQYLGTETKMIPFKMVSLGGFPGLIPTDYAHCSMITYEVFRVTDKRVENGLDMLEGYPDFYQKTVIDTQWGKANLYILSEKRYGNRTIVESGDWKEFAKSRY